MRKASTKMLEQGIQRHPLLQTSSPLKPKHQPRTNIEIGTANGGTSGQHSTYWNLYFGWGVLVAVLLLALASILWILPDLATLRPRSAGAISAIVAIASLFGAYLSFRFFYMPPFLLFSIICATLTGATTQLLRPRNE